MDCLGTWGQERLPDEPGSQELKTTVAQELETTGTQELETTGVLELKTTGEQEFKTTRAEHLGDNKGSGTGDCCSTTGTCVGQTASLVQGEGFNHFPSASIFLMINIVITNLVRNHLEDLQFCLTTVSTQHQDNHWKWE